MAQKSKTIIKGIKNIWININSFYNNYISAILSIIAFAVSTYSLVSYLMDLKQEISEVAVGIGPFQTGTKEDFELQHIQMFKEVNDNLRGCNSKYRFYPVILNGYNDLIQKLKTSETLKMTSVPPFTYLLNRDSLNAGVKHRDHDLILMGYKIIDKRTIYKTRMIWRSNSTETYKSILEKIEKHDKRIKFICTNEEISTSCHIVPEIFFMEKGVNFRAIPHDKMPRRDMYDTIINNKNEIVIGFTNDYDWNQIKKDKTEKLDFYELPIPIPRDVFLARKDWWNGISEKERINIQKSYMNTSFGMIPKDCPDTILYRYDIFKLYIASGIVETGKSLTNNCIIDTFAIIPENRFDILRLHKQFDSRGLKKMKIIKFTVGDINANNSTFDTVVVGNAYACKYVGDTVFLQKCIIDKLRLKDGELAGCHVLLE